MGKHDFVTDYNAHAANLERMLQRDEAMRLAIGGNYIPFGLMERNLLRQYGLTGNEFVVDVGCGSGRLANALVPYAELRYLGTDVVEPFLKYARQITGRKDWRFVRTDGLVVPEKDGAADFVTFFSVFTHLLHEESYTYLLEARRVLRPGGVIIFSFLDFAIGSHWSIHQGNVQTVRNRGHLNMFMGKEAVVAFARHLGLELVDLFDGDRPHIQVPEPITLEDGSVVTGLGSMGQSVAVYRKPLMPAT